MLHNIVPYKMMLRVGTLTQSQNGRWLPAGKPDLHGQGIKNWNPRTLDQAGGLQSPGQYKMCHGFVLTPSLTSLNP